MSAPKSLDSPPHVEHDPNADGTGEWHENNEIRRLLRPMTDEEVWDFRNYDRALYRARARRAK
jgi:hypothetical protein